MSEFLMVVPEDFTEVLNPGEVSLTEFIELINGQDWTNFSLRAYELGLLPEETPVTDARIFDSRMWIKG